MRLKIETSAGGIVYKQEKADRYWLVVQHAGKKHWGFPKGHIGDKVKSEVAIDAALREVKEEGGITTKVVHETPIDIHYMYRMGEFLHKKTVYYFLMEYIAGDPKDHDWEIQEAKFVPEKEIQEILTFKNDKEAFNKALELLKYTN